jgi:hypothetical protein
VALAAILSALALLETDRPVEAARPGALARFVPAAPLVLLETDDLPALIGRWRDCQLRRNVESTGVYRRCRASRLAARLGERRDLLDASLSSPLSWDRLASLPGDQGGLALYSVGRTAFVLWLRLDPGAAADLDLLRRGLPTQRTSRDGVRYAVHEGGEGTAPTAFAVVGRLLVLSNDLETFDRALSLAAGEGGAALAADPVYADLVRRAPDAAQAHLYLDMGRLVTTRQFQRYWVHGNTDDLRDIDRALISLTFAEDRTVERRLLRYRAGATRRLPAGGAGGARSPAERLAALPAGVYSSMGAVDADRASRAARWVWPAPAGGGEDLGALRDLLARGRVTQAVEVVRLFLDRNWFFPQDRLAVAFDLDAPEAMATTDVVAAASAALARSVGAPPDAGPLARRQVVRGVSSYSFAPALPGGLELTLARSRDDAVLVLATSGELALELAGAAAPTAPLGQALAAGGPDVVSLDFVWARRSLSKRLATITAPSGQDLSRARALLADDLPELLAAPQISRVERLASRDGDLDVQEVRYVY